MGQNTVQQREAVIENLVKHDVYAGNNLFGEALFLRLPLPETWQLAPGVSRPEVSATHERRNHTWVVSGRAWFVVHQPEQKWALELAMNLHPLSKRHAQLAAGEASVAGHPASVSWHTRRRGLPWNRHDVTFMTLDFNCPLSERRIQLEFSGWCPQLGFQEMLQAMRQLSCH